MSSGDSSEVNYAMEVSIHRASPVWFVHWLAIHRASPVPIYAIWLYTGLDRTFADLALVSIYQPQ